MKYPLCLVCLTVFFFSPNFSVGDGIEMDAKNNIWRSQYDYENQVRDYGTYDGYEDYNAKHPNGEHYYCINGIVKVKTQSGIWMTYSENTYGTPLKCGDRLYNNRIKKWMRLD